MLYETDVLGGKVVSVTTDGFITNINDLEGRVLAVEGNSLVKSVRRIRMYLSGDPTCLEKKHEGKGIMS